MVARCDAARCAGRRGEAKRLPASLADDGALAHLAEARGEAKRDGKHRQAGPDGCDCEGHKHQQRSFYSKLTFFMRNRLAAILTGLACPVGTARPRAGKHVILSKISWYYQLVY